MVNQNIYKLPQKARVLKALIRDHFDSWQPEVNGLISPRNYLYDLELLWNVKLHRKEINTPNGSKYTEYRIPNVKTMKRAIELFKEKGGKLTEQEESTALNKTEILELTK